MTGESVSLCMFKWGARAFCFELFKRRKSGMHETCLSHSYFLQASSFSEANVRRAD